MSCILVSANISLITKALAMPRYAFLQKLKLSHQLWIGMVALPVLSVILLVFYGSGYAAENSGKAWIGMTVIGLCLLIPYTLFSVLFIKQLTYRIVSTKEALHHLSLGETTYTTNVSGNDE